MKVILLFCLIKMLVLTSLFAKEVKFILMGHSVQNQCDHKNHNNFIVQCLGIYNDCAFASYIKRFSR